MLRVILLLFIVVSLNASAQEKLSERESTEHAQALLTATTKALGGQAYLNVKSERSRGYLTPYKENIPESLALQSFVDYIVLPDKERVEFKGQGRRFIQSNAGIQGWVYDSDSQLLRDQTEAQRQRFVRGLRYQLDQILRGGWSAPGVRLSYLPRQEIWLHQFAEGVSITYADGEEANLFFDPQTQLPLALRFPKETDKDGRVSAENRFFKYLDIGSVKAPYIVDLYENGTQTLRINYEEREFNVSVPEKIFSKPESTKSLK